MDKSAESSSDSESSTSWVFVDDVAVSQQKTPNTFHLDCSREPIQELTEQDLAAASSDFESDTDGVSVISESEIGTDDGYSNIDSVEISDNSNQESAKNDAETNNSETTIVSGPSEEQRRLSNFEFIELLKTKHLIGMCMVVAAVFVAFYSRNILRKAEKHDLGEIAEPNNVKSFCTGKNRLNNGPLLDSLGYNKQLLFNNLNKKHTVGDNINADLDKIIDIAVTCALGKQSNNNLNKVIKQCAEKEYYLFKKNSVKHNYKKEKMQKKQKNQFNKQMKILDTTGDGEQKCTSINICGEKQNRLRNQKNRTLEKSKYKKVDPLKKQRKQKHGGEILKNDEDEIKIKKQHKYKTSNHLNKGNKSNRYDEYEKMKNNKKTSDKGYTKSISDKRYKKKPGENGKVREVKIDSNTSKENQNNPSGEWYINLHKARSQRRKQQHVSDWVFDRAQVRSNNRNKALWYFKWMNVREQLRYKSYKPYSS